MMRALGGWPALLGIAAAAALGFALFVEHVGRIAPCELCLVERWPFRIAIAISLVALAWPRGRRALLALALADLAASVALAAVHVGVELHAWQSPFPECRAPRVGNGTIAQQLASLPARPDKPCDAATYLVPGVPVSMAAANLAFSMLLLVSLPLAARAHRIA